MLLLGACSFALALAIPSAAQAQAFRPATIPIAARSPYLSNFLPTNPSVTHSKSRTWQTGYSTQVQAWAGLIRVDGVTYAWAGDISTMPSGIMDPEPTGEEQLLTPTSSVFTYQAGPLELTVTFLSPIEPGDLVKQSIPASYAALDVHATDGASHSVQVYTDITAEWVSGDRTQTVNWTTDASDPNMIYHAISAVKQTPYQEIQAQAAWGTVYYASPRTANTTFKTSGDITSRGLFNQTGTLDNSQNTTFRGISVDFPVFAFAQDLGTIQQTTAPLVWAVANVRDSGTTGALTYTDLSQQKQTRSLYYRSQYTDDHALLSDFLADYLAALNRSKSLDTMITQAATSVASLQYADILALATRQAYSGIEITAGRNADGSVNASDVMAFYKDTGTQVSGNGNTQVNPVDGLISVFPAFLYLDPPLCGILLEPLLRFQESSSYGNPYAALDLGPQYPQAVANGDPHSEGIETSSGMIIMAYGHAKRTGDHGIIQRYFALFKNWADFLTSNILNATSQTAADGSPLSGQTNLALKGMIAVQAMSNISALLNDSENRDLYSSQAKTLYSQWLTKALSLDGHLRFNYEGADSSFSLGYNMFWDLILGTGLLDTDIVANQTSYIAEQILPFGAPTDSTNVSVVSANWNMLAAAVATRDASTQQTLIDNVYKLANSQPSNLGAFGQFPLKYTAQDGAVITGQSSPRQGAVYAPLLVNASSFLGGINANNTQTEVDKDSHGRTPVGIIVGAALGAVALLSLIAVLFFFFRRRRLSPTRKRLDDIDTPTQEAMLGGASPVTRVPGITPFLEMNPSVPLSSVWESVTVSSDYQTSQEAGSKRAYRLRRELDQRAGLPSGPSGPAASPSVAGTHPATPPSAVSDHSDSAYSQGLVHEINNLWREISAMRVNDDTAAPPEYNA